MKIDRQNSRSGIALIIVMVMIVVLGILAGGFAYRMKVETTLARRATFTSDLDWAARSGIEVAKWVLAQSMQGPDGRADSLKQKWAGGPGTTNDILSSIDLKNYPLLGPDGSITANLSIEIKDLDRKFNINAVDEALLKEAITLIGVDAAESSKIANSILDWRDTDRDPRMGGAEDDFYQRQREEGYPPYSAKNGPIDDLSELLLVQGVTPAMYFGSSGGAANPIIQRRNSARVSHFEEPNYAVGFVDLFTPISSRMVNINTASETVLQMIPGIDGDMAQAIVRGGPMSRAGIDGIDGSEDDMPFTSVGEMFTRIPQLQQLPGAQQLLSRYLTTRSLIFEVKVSIDIGGTRRECVAIVRRNSPKDVQTLNMYWKS